MHHPVESIQIVAFSVLLLLSAVMYFWAIGRLLLQRTLPDSVAPPRITLLALGLCASKAILGTTIYWLQVPITIIVVMTCLYAVFCILRNVVVARRMTLEQRSDIDRWAVVMIPPVLGVGLISLQLGVTDAQASLLIDAFIFTNSIPAVYLLIQLPFLLSRRRAYSARIR